MRFLVKLIDGAAKYAGEIVITSASVLVFAAADQWLSESTFEAIGRHTTGRVVVGLVVAFLFVLAILIYRAPRLVYDPRLGTYRDRKGVRYCPRCVVDRKKRMPLREFPSEWWCYTCKVGYSSPDHKQEPASQRRVVDRGVGWLDRWRY